MLAFLPDEVGLEQGLPVMENYKHALSLLEEATRIMVDIGDTLVAAHIATSIDVIETRLIALRGTQRH